VIANDLSFPCSSREVISPVALAAGLFAGKKALPDLPLARLSWAKAKEGPRNGADAETDQ
jgi:hypothetical protein